MFHALVLAASLDASPSPTPSPTPAPTSTPVPAYSLDGTFSLYSAHTNGVNATGAVDQPSGQDIPNRTELSNALLIVTKNTGVIRAGVTVGAYAFPTVGVSFNPTVQNGANTMLYGWA